MESKLKGKKVLLVGLGILGGGVATAKWLLKQGAYLTITDFRSGRELKSSLRELGAVKKKIRFMLGRHEMNDFVSHDLIVINPAVKIIGNKYLLAAKRAHIPVVNDLALFLDAAFLVRNFIWGKPKLKNRARNGKSISNVVKNPVAAITGTRGKTTTANWVAHFLKVKHKGVKVSGNSSDEALLKLLPKLEKDKKVPIVLELSSFQLELETPDFQQDNSRELSCWRRTPDVAIITNLFRDHLNRHETIKNYALAKANIFKNQNKNKSLILNFDDKWTNFFLSKKPKSKIYFISTNKFPKGLSGLMIAPMSAPVRRPLLISASPPRFAWRDRGGGQARLPAHGGNRKIVFCDGKKKKSVFGGKTLKYIKMLGEHNLYNFLFASLAAHLVGVSWKDIEERIKTLPQIFLRQEIILKKKNLTVVNDSAGTSPDATIAAIKRFSGVDELILITGGTDKKLEFAGLAREIKRNIKSENLFLLNGSATKKLISELNKMSYFEKQKPQLFENLKSILKTIRIFSYHSRFWLASPAKRGELHSPLAADVFADSHRVILFSPGAASFEKFKNEFDRGRKFSLYSKQIFK